MLVLVLEHDPENYESDAIFLINHILITSFQISNGEK